MALRLNVLTVFLLILLASTVSAKGNSKKKKKPQRTVTLSDNINKNPFLQNTLSDNKDRNSSHLGDGATVNGNVFLSHSTKLPPSSQSNNGEKPGQVSSGSDGATANGNVFLTHSTKLPPSSQSNNGGKPGQVAHNTNPFLKEVLSGGTRAPTPFVSNTESNRNPVTEKISYTDETPGEKDRFGHPKAKSVRMCEEYGRQSSVDTSVISPLTSNPTAITLNTTTCMPVNRLVVGGVTATPNEFPHMVAMAKKTDEGFKIACGASLIAPEWILTAAHCTHGGSTDILIGYHDLRNTKGGISTTINETVRHPEYKPPSLYNDIALIKLNKVIQFNNRIKPACLYETYERVPAKAWISGWGDLEFLGESSNTLQKAELEIIDNIKCALRHTDSLRLPNGITPDMICAGAPSEKWSKDTCQGDSGGPLQIIHPNNNCLFQLVGVTSFGLGCAFDNMPAVYTKVSHYINWIEDIVWPTA